MGDSDEAIRDKLDYLQKQEVLLFSNGMMR